MDRRVIEYFSIVARPLPEKYKDELAHSPSTAKEMKELST
jgi:hypothetical protein